MWKAIDGYKNIYEISDSGKVRRVDTGNILKGHIGSDGYHRVGLTVSSKTKIFLLHRLIATAFIPQS